MTSRQLLLSFLAKEGDPNSSGRQMPQHFGSKELNIVSQSSPTGTQYLQAVGAGFALKRNKSKSIGSPLPGATACLININFPPSLSKSCKSSSELATNVVLKDINKNIIILINFIHEH